MTRFYVGELKHMDPLSQHYGSLFIRKFRVAGNIKHRPDRLNRELAGLNYSHSEAIYSNQPANTQGPDLPAIGPLVLVNSSGLARNLQNWGAGVVGGKQWPALLFRHGSVPGEPGTLLLFLCAFMIAPVPGSVQDSWTRALGFRRPMEIHPMFHGLNLHFSSASQTGTE